MAQYGRSPGPAALQKTPMQRTGNMPRTGNLQFEGYRDPNMRNADPFSNYRGLKTTQVCLIFIGTAGKVCDSSFQSCVSQVCS